MSEQSPKRPRLSERRAMPARARLASVARTAGVSKADSAGCGFWGTRIGSPQPGQATTDTAAERVTRRFDPHTGQQNNNAIARPLRPFVPFQPTPDRPAPRADHPEITQPEEQYQSYMQTGPHRNLIRAEFIVFR